MYRQLRLLLWNIQQPLGDNCLDFHFSSNRQRVVNAHMFVLLMYFLLNCYD